MNEAIPASLLDDVEEPEGTSRLSNLVQRIKRAWVPIALGTTLALGAGVALENHLTSVPAIEQKAPTNLDALDPRTVNIGDKVWVRKPGSDEILAVIVKNFARSQHSEELIGIIGIPENQPDAEVRQDLYTFDALVTEKTALANDLPVHQPQE